VVAALAWQLLASVAAAQRGWLRSPAAWRAGPTFECPGAAGPRRVRGV